MNTRKTAAAAVVRHLEAVTCRRTLAAELRVRNDVGGWAW